MNAMDDLAIAAIVQLVGSVVATAFYLRITPDKTPIEAIVVWLLGWVALLLLLVEWFECWRGDRLRH